jgi:crotonobetainyl-CoA:carnitine CoA-transferase CaiB-like acyl-CoA transferase
MLVAQTKDGYWLQFAQQTPHLFKAFLKALDLERVAASDPEFAACPRFDAYEPALRFWHIMLETVHAKTLAEWQDHLQDYPDVGMEVFRYVDEALDHPQLSHNGSVIALDDPEVGATQQLGPVMQLFSTPAGVAAPAPGLGEHTAEILGRLASGAWEPVRPAQSAPVPRRPLEDVTVLDLCMWYAAPYGSALLADLGARVIKIEVPRGDDMRRASSIPEAATVKSTQGKESLSVDLATDEGRRIVHALAKNADLVLTGYRGEVNRKLGVDYETLRAINPRIVYVNAPGYGIDGPFARQPAYAASMTAASGATLLAAGPAFPGRDLHVSSVEQHRGLSLLLSGRETGMGMANGDGVAANTVATSLLLGLLARERTGAGQEILAAMIGSNAFAAAELIRYDGKRPARNVDAQRRGFDALERAYETKDGWVFLGATFDEGWRALVCAFEELSANGRSLLSDARFAGGRGRAEHDAEIRVLLEFLFKTRTADEWEELFVERKVPCVKVEARVPALFCIDDPIMLENGYVDEVDHPLFGVHPRMGPVVQLSLTPGESRPGCLNGQHTESILTELGYSLDSIAELERKKIVCKW